MLKTLYVLYVGDVLKVTHSSLEKALEWQKAISGSVIYEATLKKYEETI
tara:strand:- start:9693 stop:9839 length:147 start_codon:yes stop_codon:yes gene_type:complete